MARYIDADNISLKGISVFDQNLEVLIPLSDVRKALQMTPTADVKEVRHGRWINESHNTYGPISAQCSVCELFSGTWLRNDPYKYCPHCGAKMDGKE